MKKFLLTIIITLISLPALAITTPSEKETLCSCVSHFAHNIMSVRQSGIAKENVINAMEDELLTSNDPDIIMYIEQIGLVLAKQVYNLPLEITIEAKEKAEENYVESVYLSCMEGIKI